MDVPLPFLPVYPGECAAKLRHEVIAPRLIAIPPAAGDALGSGDQRELSFFHRKSFFQEPRGPRPRLHELVRVPFAGLDAAPRMLRAMVGISADAVDRVAAEARLQPLETLRPLLGFRGAVAAKPAAVSAARREIR